MIGGKIFQLRKTPDYDWNIETLENPNWVREIGTRGLSSIACVIWALMDGKVAGINGPKDIRRLLNEQNQDEVLRAVDDAFSAANPPKDSKKEDGSMPSPSPASNSA